MVCDFAPLAPARRRRERLAAGLVVPLIEVDARNVVPAWDAADKQIYAAHHLRGRYERLLPSYLAELPDPPRAAGAPSELFSPFDREAALAFVRAGEYGPPIALPAGERAARAALDAFIETRLDGYAARRGDPSTDAQSGLSPYLHFGQLSVQRAVTEVMAAGDRAGLREDVAEFVDEAVMWRELADNFCLFQPATRGSTASRTGRDARWPSTPTTPARSSTRRPSSRRPTRTTCCGTRPRPELVRTGKMHNYLRMYWAKKILEWSESPEQAMRIAVLLNDRYSLDGRESNGYAGIAWSIGGVHDRAWPERAVYGKIRYMNYNGAKRKFDVAAYIERATGADGARAVLEQPGLGRRLQPEVLERGCGGDAPARSALQQALAEQVGLDDVFDRVLGLADGGRQRGEPDRSAAELLADRLQQHAVEAVETLGVDLEEVRAPRRRPRSVIWPSALTSA